MNTPVPLWWVPASWVLLFMVLCTAIVAGSFLFFVVNRMRAKRNLAKAAKMQAETNIAGTPGTVHRLDPK